MILNVRWKANPGNETADVEFVVLSWGITLTDQKTLFFQNAQHVEVESIPLPDMPHAPSNILIQDIPLPGAQPPSILKKTSAYG